MEQAKNKYYQVNLIGQKDFGITVIINEERNKMTFVTKDTEFKTKDIKFTSEENFETDNAKFKIKKEISRFGFAFQMRQNSDPEPLVLTFIQNRQKY